MAKKPENVFNLLNNLWEKAIPVAKNEVKEMQKIIDREGGNFRLEPSDWWYYAEKLRKQKYDLDDNELRPYFKLENVRDGVFTCANKLYGITFEHPLTVLCRPSPSLRGERRGRITYRGAFHGLPSTRNKRQAYWCGGYRVTMLLMENR